MTAFLVGMLFGGLAAAFLGWLDDAIRRELRHKRERAKLHRFVGSEL